MNTAIDRKREKSRAYNKKWREANREKLREQKRRSREKYKVKYMLLKREQRAAISAKRRDHKRKWEAKNPEAVRMQGVRRMLRAKAKSIEVSFRCNYNITLDDYQAVHAAQGGGCAICRTTQSVGRSKRLSVDHDHETGIVRALLCMRCNSALGYFSENPDLLRRAATYLEAFRAETNNPDWGSRVRRVLGVLSQKGSPEARRASVAQAQPEFGFTDGDTDCFGLAIPATELVKGQPPVRPECLDVSKW
jgi:hypothetical protein